MNRILPEGRFRSWHSFRVTQTQVQGIISNPILGCNSPPVMTECKCSGPSSDAEIQSSTQDYSKDPLIFGTVEDKNFQGQRSKSTQWPHQSWQWSLTSCLFLKTKKKTRVNKCRCVESGFSYWAKSLSVFTAISRKIGNNTWCHH